MFVNRRFPAMDIAISAAGALIVAASVAATIRVTLRDGYRRLPTRFDR